MRLYLSVDMEGITGIADETFIDSGKRNYSRGQHLMTAEVNHVIVAVLEAGCGEVVVNDSHSKMNNLLIEELHPEAQLIFGDVKPFSMVQGLEAGVAGAMFLGYHARAARKGVLSHTMTAAVSGMYLNDSAIGELGLNAYVAGYYGVPVLMVTGDDQTALEAEALIPGVTTVVVKKYLSRTAAVCLSPAKTAELLREKAKAAVRERGNVQPLIPPDHPVLTIQFANHGQAEWANLMPGTEIVEGTSAVRFQAKTMLEAYRGMIAMTELAAKAAFS
ncbi:D-amino peptidase [Evansella caseinilytica]|uniref:D-amino peptidase n=1 Tax=Evansella caseinilytica TaxID=1503961 RepID=A0A1H3UJ07_9BACI|nr:M55 family metallopeptidase [Evansella caseinilytica]SDZ61669.1 D-amino peptidase [Evansella caseinilytica]